MRFLLAGISGLLFSAVLLFSGAIRGIDHALYDMIARGSARIDGIASGGSDGSGGHASGTVELIYVDQYSLGWVERNLGIAWPWPRELYGIIASFCSQAKGQAFDIIFSETSSFGPEDDARCAEAMDEAGNVVIAEALDPSGGGRLRPLPTNKVDYGRVAGLVDADGILRRYEAGYGGAAKALNAQGAADAVGEAAKAPARASDTGAGEGATRPGSAASLGLALLAKGGDVPGKQPSGDVYLRFRGGSPTFPALNAAEILSSAISLREGREPQVDPERYAGKYLLIGFSAPGLLDRQAVPTDRAMPGAEIHATFVDNALRGRLLGTLPAAAELLLVCFFALSAAWASTHLKKPALLTGGAALFAFLPMASGFALYRAGLVASMGLGISSGLFSYAAGIILSYVSEGRNKAFLRRSFSQYLSPSVIDAILRNPGLLRLGGEERVLSVFFSDIQGFTALSESMAPESLAAFMNNYLSIVTGEILAEGGTIDKYVGDAVVAFWNAPLDQNDHAGRAVRAALRCQKALGASREVFASLGTPVPVTRIGIHTGKAIVGNMGSPSRFNYTALGDVVNTASRLENANKATGTRILVSGDTVAACATWAMPPSPASAGGLAAPDGSLFGKNGASADGLEFRRLGQILVYGKKVPVEVWEPRSAGEKPGPAQPWTGVRDCSAV
ncbi:MAG TPA: adenylate/guanylate cyclase domain-containing protein [Rectinemataceae bacterium]|nr:adenylate/guanylate cyclase domain-containing protein [Rectinemataceae bacterium]